MRVSVQWGAAAALALAAGAQAAQVTYGFGAITSNGSSAFANSYNGQLSVTVSDVGVPAGFVEFIFQNNVGLASSITDVYFDDGTLLGIASISQSSGVDFSQGASPGNLPGGNTMAVPFQTTAGFSADSNSPQTSANGVDAAIEWLNVRFQLISGQTFADVIAALDGGEDLRIGIHVQAQANGQSNGYVNTVTVVPLPMGAWAGATALAGLGGLGWLRRRSLRA